MSVEHRLSVAQATLYERGVKDVKFFIQPAPNAPVSRTMADAACFLEAVLEGEVVEMEPVDEMPQLR